MKTNIIFGGIATRRIAQLRWILPTSLLMAIILSININAFSQTNQLETDKGMQNSVASYDSDVRQAILLASQYPQTLSQLQQEKTKHKLLFKDLSVILVRKSKVGFMNLLVSQT